MFGDYTTITAKSIPEAYKKAVYNVWNFGEEVEDERGDTIRELLDLKILINSVDCSHVSGFERLNKDFADGLVNKDLALKKGDDFVYAYGDRLYIFDQLNKTIGRLIKNSTTRRAYIPIFDKIDNCGAVDIPCWTSLQFIIRNGSLNMIDYFRSNDMFLAFPSDGYGARTLQHYVADRVGVPVGWFSHHVGSAHIRMTDQDAVEAFLSHLRS